MCVVQKSLFWLSNTIQWCLGSRFECDHCGVGPLRWKQKTGFSLAFNYIITLRNNNLFFCEINVKVSRHIHSYVAYIKIRITLGFIFFKIFFKHGRYQSFLDTLYFQAYNFSLVVLMCLKLNYVNPNKFKPKLCTLSLVICYTIFICIWWEYGVKSRQYIVIWGKL